jgi:hypothetical protein
MAGLPMPSRLRHRVTPVPFGTALIPGRLKMTKAKRYKRYDAEFKREAILILKVLTIDS